MQCRPAHHLHIEVTLTDHSHRGLANDRKCLNHQVVNIFSAFDALTKFNRLGLQRHIRKLLKFGFVGVDVGHQRGESLYFFALAGTQNSIQECHAVNDPTCAAYGRE